MAAALPVHTGGCNVPCTLDLDRALDELAPIAAEVHALQKDIKRREAEVLGAILKKLRPFVPLLSSDFDSYCYRRFVVII